MKNLVKILSGTALVCSLTVLIGCPPPGGGVSDNRTRACDLITKYGGAQSQADNCKLRTSSELLTTGELAFLCDLSKDLSPADENFLRSILTTDQESSCAGLGGGTGSPSPAATPEFPSSPSATATPIPTASPTFPTGGGSATPTPSATATATPKPDFGSGGGNGGGGSGPVGGSN